MPFSSHATGNTNAYSKSKTQFNIRGTEILFRVLINLKRYFCLLNNKKTRKPRTISLHN